MQQSIYRNLYDEKLIVSNNNALKADSIETGFAKFNFFIIIIIVRRSQRYSCTQSTAKQRFFWTLSL